MAKLVFRLETIAYVLLDIAQTEGVTSAHLKKLRIAAPSFSASLAEAYYIQTSTPKDGMRWSLKLNDKIRNLENAVEAGKVTANQFFRMVDTL